MVKERKLLWSQTDGLHARFRSDGARTVQSLEPQDINVVFQPIVDLATGKEFAYEALVRCQVPEYRSPASLFARAELEKSCGRLGRIIRQVAFEHASGKILFVNIHPDELNSRWLVQPDDPLCFHDSPLFLEITESATLEHFELCMSVLKEVCSRSGAHLVIDDLGAGYSNLKRIVDLEPEIVKFDLTLAHGIDKYPRQRTLVTQLVGLCHELHAKVVVEGIETLDQLLAARDTGAEYAQGFLLAAPGFPAPAANWPLSRDEG